MLQFLLLLVYILPFALSAILSAFVNIRREKRNAQILNPVLGTVFVILLIVFLDRIGTGFRDLVTWLGTNVSFLSFLRDLDLVYGVTYILNALIILAFVAVKSLLRPLMLKMHSSEKIMQVLTGRWYECIPLTQAQLEELREKESKRGKKRRKKRGKRASSRKKEEENDERWRVRWYVKRSYSEVRKVFLGLYIGAVVVSCLLFILAGELSGTSAFTASFYPALGVLILGEIFFFLNGYTYREAEEKRKLKPPAQEVEYEPIRKKYEELFPARLKESGSILRVENKKDASEALIEQYEEEYKLTNSHDAELLGEYTKLLAKRKQVDENLMSSVRRLLDGESVLFASPFYEKVTDYIFLFLLRRLMENDRVLLVMGRNGAESNIVDWVKRGLTGINGFDELWKISSLEEADESSDLIYVPLRHIYGQELFQKKRKILSEVGVVILFDASRLLGTMQMGLSVLVNYVRKGKKPQFVVFDRNCDGLVDSLSHVLHTSIEEVVPTARNSIDCGEMIWNADGAMLQSKLGVNTSRYFGMGVELAMLAVRNKVSRVSWLSYEKFPNRDMRWIMLQYYVPICKALGIPESKSALEERIDLCVDPWAMRMRKNAYLVIEDEYNNIYETARQFSALATEQEFMHIISQNYLLKDYMAAHADLFRDDPKAIPNIVPDYQRSVKNSVYKVLMRLVAGELPEEDAEELLAHCGWAADGKSTVFERLLNVLKTYFKGTDVSDERLKEVLVREEHASADIYSEKKEVFYSVKDKEFIDEFLSQLKISYYVAEDVTERGVLGARLYGHVYQDFLPGVFTILDGKYYEVISVSKAYGVEVRRAADHLTQRRYYRQLRNYKVSGFKALEETASRKSYGKVWFEIGEAEIEVDTYGYLEMSDFGDMKHANKVLINDVEKRTYRNKTVMRVNLEGSTPEVRTTIAVMINEIFVSLFPDTHNFICAAVSRQENAELDGYLPELSTDEPDDGYVYIIEDSLIDLGLLICVSRYFMRIMDIICDLLTWHGDVMREEEKGEASVGGAPEQEPAKPEGPAKPEAPVKPEESAKPEEPAEPEEPEKPEEPAEPQEPEGAEEPEEPAEPQEPEGPAKPEEGKKERRAGGLRKFLEACKARRAEKRERKKQEKAEKRAGSEEKKKQKEQEKLLKEQEKLLKEQEKARIRKERKDAKRKMKEQKEHPSAEPASDVSEETNGADGSGTALTQDGPEREDVPEAASEREDEAPEATPEREEAPEAASEREEAPEAASEREEAPEAAPEREEAPEAASGPEEKINFYKLPDRDAFMHASAGPDRDEGEQDEVEGEEAVTRKVDLKDGSLLPEEAVKPYSQRYFMLYGHEKQPEFLKTDETLAYLKEIGLENNYLHQARRKKKELEQQQYYNWQFKEGKHYCDFCGKLMEEKMEVLADGRERCPECSETAVSKLSDYKRVYKETRKKMAILFGITIRSKIKVKFANAQDIAQRRGSTFEPTPGMDGRVLGYAMKKGNKRYICMENGSPRTEMEMTLVHELTHQWQYENWDEAFVLDRSHLPIMEGMAEWSAAQYIASMGLTQRAEDFIRRETRRNDEYGAGLRMFLEVYPVYMTMELGRTPFELRGDPLSQQQE